MVVVGINNVRLRDEGVGVHIVNAPASGYQENNNVAIMDGGTAGMELLPPLEGADHLIVVDAIRCGQPPASIFSLEDARVPAYFRTKLSPHQVGLSDVVAALAFKGAVPGHAVLSGNRGNRVACPSTTLRARSPKCSYVRNAKSQKSRRRSPCRQRRYDGLQPISVSMQRSSNSINFSLQAPLLLLCAPGSRDPAHR